MPLAYPLRTFAVFLSLALPLLADDEGRLQNIDSKAHTVTITAGRATRTYHYRPSVEVQLAGQRAELKELLPGMQLKIKTSEKDVAARILALDPTSFDQHQFPEPTIFKVRGRTLTITGIIPGADAIKVHATGIWWEHLSAMRHGNPERVTINGMKWIPEWKERTSTKLTFQPALADFPSANIQVEKASGRQEMKIELPNAENNSTLTVQLIDSPVGSGPADVRIKW